MGNFLDLIDVYQIKLLLQLLLALVLGGMFGLEREYVGKAAGVRTFALVSFGAALFTLISVHGFQEFLNGVSNYDPSRIASQIVTGIGFLGMAVIIRRGLDVRGITTAATMWAAAGIGMAVGVGFYTLAIGATLFAFIVTAVLRILNVEAWIKKARQSSFTKKQKKI